MKEEIGREESKFVSGLNGVSCINLTKYVFYLDSYYHNAQLPPS